MEENRMDRIEREMAEFLVGMRELREAQRETGEQIGELREAQRKTGEQIGEMREAQRETGEQIGELREAQRETGEHIRELRKAQRETREQISELREAQKETDKQLARTDKQLARTDEQLARTDEQLARTGELLAKTIIKLDNVGASLGEMGLVQGKVAEDLFYRNVRSLFRQRDLPFAEVRRNVKKKGVAEYDIVASDRNRVLVVEVKNRLERDMVDDFLNRKIPKFRQVFPQYGDCRLMGGVGALVMHDDVGRYAEKKGLYVMTQNGEGGAMLINRQNFRAKEFS